MIVLFSDITIGFENSTYFTNEFMGTVEVCVAKMTGQLQQPIIATVTSADVDAQGDHLLIELLLKVCHSQSLTNFHGQLPRNKDSSIKSVMKCYH